MAQASLPANSSATGKNELANSPRAPPVDISWPGFLKYKPPFEEPTITLTYELDYSLTEVIDTFKSMVFDSVDKLPQRLHDKSKFVTRKMTFVEKSKSNKGEFAGNENQNLCEVIKFDTLLLPLIPGFDAKEYEKKLKENQEKEQANSNAKASGWSSWTSMSSWKEWGSGMMDMQSWANSMNSWMQYLNMNTQAAELWKIDWIQHKAVSFVKNITFSWTIGVYEYAEIEQLMHLTQDEQNNDDNEEKTDADDQNKGKNKVKFIKKLFVYPIVPMPGFLMDLLKEQYQKDSDLQISIIKDLCEEPLVTDKEDQNEPLQQLQDV
eukprot:CAMPEP_0197028962 /NCGR_PEP_ID=MMETSP1384-20130603/8526_1 /TAXON_ID=29189 /ORGANISM="Ammonia sp." /LENGTH=321 /DNA_ID=CAMNT_0042458045 /DNA_START=14 /DNA_END=979 /DNA_ORIENTATION=-